MLTSETVSTQTQEVYCSGAEYPLDHPKIYLEIDKKIGHIICPYCSKKFVLATSK